MRLCSGARSLNVFPMMRSEHARGSSQNVLKTSGLCPKRLIGIGRGATIWYGRQLHGGQEVRWMGKVAVCLADILERRGAVLVAAALVLGLADALSNVVGHTGLFALASEETPVLPVNGKIPFELGLLVMSLLTAAYGRMLVRHIGIYTVACVAALIVGMVLCRGTILIPVTMRIAGLFVFGMGFIGAKFFGFYLLYLKGSLSYVVMGIALEKLGKTALASLVFLMSPLWQTASTYVIVACLAACLVLFRPWVERCREFGVAPVVVGAGAEGKRGTYRNLVGQAVLASVILAVTQSFTPYGVYGAAPVQDAEHFAVYLAMAVLVPLAAWFFFVRVGRERREERYRNAFMLVLVGLFVVSTQSGATWTLAPFVSALMLDFLEMFGHVVFVATTFPVWWTRPRASLGPIGAFMAVFSAAALVWIVAVQEAYAFAVLLALVVAYAGTVAVSKLLPRAIEVGAARRELVDERYLRIVASEHGLSARETDVFLLLAQGRSRSYIQEELSISEGTVKTHTSRIYQKIGVRSKQEMLSFIYDSCEEKE